MYKFHNFTIYIPTFNLTVLAILSILVVNFGALYCKLPTCLWMCHLSTGHPGPYNFIIFSILSDEYEECL